MFRGRHHGFSLLELLVVIVLIGILAMLIITGLARVRESARRTSCASNLKQIGTAMFMYANVPTNRILPTANGTTSDPYVVGASSAMSLSLLYKGYVMDPKCFFCPSLPLPPSHSSSLLAVPALPGRPAIAWWAASTSYGYDPGHTTKDEATALAADAQPAGSALGSKVNSNNHGIGAGQNVLIGAGTVMFKEDVQNTLGTDSTGTSNFDANIYGNDVTANFTRDMDGQITGP